MILILIAILSLLVLSLWLHKNCHSYAMEVISTIFTTAGLLSLLLYFVVGYSYISSGYKVKIINRECNKNYTQEDFFYAKDIIRKIEKKCVL